MASLTQRKTVARTVRPRGIPDDDGGARLEVGPPTPEDEADQEQVAVPAVPDGRPVGPAEVLPRPVLLTLAELDVEAVMADGGHVGLGRAVPAEDVALLPVQVDGLLLQGPLEPQDHGVSPRDARVGVDGEDRSGGSGPLLVHPLLAPRQDAREGLPGQGGGGREERRRGGGWGGDSVGRTVLGLRLGVGGSDASELAEGEELGHEEWRGGAYVTACLR